MWRSRAAVQMRCAMAALDVLASHRDLSRPVPKELDMAKVKSAATEKPLDAVIVGAGFAGLYQLHLLRDRLGLDVQVLEAGEGVGGTWYWNRYPGARCDSESHAYSYMFSEDLYRQWTWTERYPGHDEIRRYLNFVADTLDLKRDIQFGQRVTSTTYDDAANLWTLETETGNTTRARFLVTAVGCLSAANMPAFPGRETFKGRAVHTGQWPHNGVDFTGKRVGMIGTGSTGIQAAPVIAETAAHLTVFQRTANYSVPAHNAPLSDEFKRWTKDNFADIRHTVQSTFGGQPFLIEDRASLETPPEERRQIYEAAWAKGGLQFRAAFRDMLANGDANKTASDFIKAKIRSIVADPATAALLADIDHPYATKRPPIDTNYFETFNRATVSLVDVKSDPIEAITPTGLTTRSGKHFPLDILVYATGFDALTGPLHRMNIRGRGGVKLSDVWAGGPRTYLGLQVAGFPNMFTITGPGSPSVLTNMPVAIEQHAEWITDCIAHMRVKGLSRIEPAANRIDAWQKAVDEAAQATLMPHTAHSWYLGANIPGKPQVFMPYVGGMPKYRGICADVVAKGYEGFVMT